MARKFSRGAIVYVRRVLDPAGKNPKDRRVVLVADFDDADPFAYAVAITGEFTVPLRPDLVRLSFHRPGNCGSSLTKESVAVCDWFVVAASQDVQEKTGFVTNKQLVEILNRVESRLKGDGDA